MAQFVLVIIKILKKHIPNIAAPFLNNITIKGAKTTYRGKEALLGVRCYILKYIQQLNAILIDLERVGCIISGAKSYFYKSEIVIIGYLCNGNGRLLKALKVAKIILQEKCKDVWLVRAFLGVYTYYRIQVINFSIIAEPLLRLLREGIVFHQGLEQL